MSKTHTARRGVTPLYLLVALSKRDANMTRRGDYPLLVTLSKTHMARRGVTPFMLHWYAPSHCAPGKETKEHARRVYSLFVASSKTQTATPSHHIEKKRRSEKGSDPLLITSNKYIWQEGRTPSRRAPAING